MAKKKLTPAVVETEIEPTYAKVRRPKLARKTPPFRKYKESPAGHFADSISSLQRRIAVMGKKTSRWGASVASAIGALSEPIEGLRVAFEGLAAEGFKPKKGGTKRIPPFFAGEKVTLSPEALSYLQKDFPNLTTEHTVIVANSYEFGDKAIPLCCYDQTKDLDQGQWLSRVSYKWVVKTSAPVAA